MRAHYATAPTNPHEKFSHAPPSDGRSAPGSRSVSPCGDFARPSERDEGLEQLFDAPDVPACEGGGELSGGDDAALRGERLPDGARLFGDGLGPRLFVLLDGGGGDRFELFAEGGGDARGGFLEFGAEPAHGARALLRGAHGVEADEAFEDFVQSSTHYTQGNYTPSM